MADIVDLEVEPLPEKEAKKITVLDWVKQHKRATALLGSVLFSVIMAFSFLVLLPSRHVEKSLRQKQLIEQVGAGETLAYHALKKSAKGCAAQKALVDPHLLNYHWQRGEWEAAEEVASAILSRTPETLQKYAAFSAISLAIDKQDFSDALQKTETLREQLKASNDEASQLYKYCTLRAAWLQKKLEQPEMSVVLAQEMQQDDLQQQNEHRAFMQCISYENVSFLDFLQDK